MAVLIFGLVRARKLEIARARKTALPEGVTASSGRILAILWSRDCRRSICRKSSGLEEPHGAAIFSPASSRLSAYMDGPALRSGERRLDLASSRGRFPRVSRSPIGIVCGFIVASQLPQKFRRSMSRTRLR